MTRRRAIGSRTDEPSNESHKNKEGRLVRCYLLGAGSEPRSGRLSRGKLSVCTWRGHFWRVGTVLFRVRGTGRGESVSTGTDGTHFVREPVLVEQPVTPRPRSYARNRRRHASRTRSTALGIIPRQQGPARTVVRPQVHSFEQESCASPRRRDSASTSQAMARLAHQNGLEPVRRNSTRCRSPSSVSCGLRC